MSASSPASPRADSRSVVEGFRIASRVALDALSNSAVDHGKDPEAFRRDLLAIARTTLSSKVLAADKDYFAELAVSAVLRLKVRPAFPRELD